MPALGDSTASRDSITASSPFPHVEGQPRAHERGGKHACDLHLHEDFQVTTLASGVDEKALLSLDRDTNFIKL